MTTALPSLALLLAGCVTAPPPSEPVPSSSPWRQEWVVLYLMPYDNDLGRFAPDVLAQLQEGSRGGVEALVLSDLPGEGGMVLTTFAEGEARPYPAPHLEDAAAPEALRFLLEQAAVLYESRRYAVVILDHGGAVEELARDDHPAPARWLTVTEVATEVAAFRQAEAGEVEALLLQVCSKATLPALYALRGTARVTLASQVLLGAPNDYYIHALRALRAQPAVGGDALGALVAQGSMYVSYTCVRNAALEALPGHLEAVASASTAAPLPLDAVADGLYVYAGDRYVDLGMLLQTEGTPQAQAALDWWTGEARCGHHIAAAPRPELLLQGPDPRRLSGVSAHLPAGGPPTALDIAAPGWSSWLRQVSTPW